MYLLTVYFHQRKVRYKLLVQGHNILPNNEGVTILFRDNLCTKELPKLEVIKDIYEVARLLLPLYEDKFTN